MPRVAGRVALRHGARAPRPALARRGRGGRGKAGAVPARRRGRGAWVPRAGDRRWRGCKKRSRGASRTRAAAPPTFPVRLSASSATGGARCCARCPHSPAALPADRGDQLDFNSGFTLEASDSEFINESIREQHAAGDRESPSGRTDYADNRPGTTDMWSQIVAQSDGIRLLLDELFRADRGRRRARRLLSRASALSAGRRCRRRRPRDDADG